MFAASHCQRYLAVRQQSLALAAPLSAEDCVVQSMPDASPIKWHLAHTTWFFETFILLPQVATYQAFDAAFKTLFNSYYVAVGERHPRPQRGLLTRPSLAQVLAYRQHVDEHMQAWLTQNHAASLTLFELGLQHEMQHQELMLTDIKHLLFCNPLMPAYATVAPTPTATTSMPPTRLPAALPWVEHAGGLAEMGAPADAQFAFDNETPRHQVLLQPHALATRLVSNREYFEFMKDDGYERPELWLSLGWDTKMQEGWRAPLYWLIAQTTAKNHARVQNRHDVPADRLYYTLQGVRAIDWGAPVCHISFFEADAYARWYALREKGARLPSEFEWEFHAQANSLAPVNVLETQHLRPIASMEPSSAQWLGNCWQWTQSPYLAYPGFAPAAGAVGEYNGKFMSQQYVLRGGSCFSPRAQVRASYRNFFPPHTRWQMSGIRLARDGRV